MNEQTFRLPGPTQRVAVMGRTGSGKTQFGAWLISEADLAERPHIIVDYKGDELLNSIDRIKEIGLNDIPRFPGLYIVHPHPTDHSGTENFLTRIWERENLGLIFDEAYMLPDKAALPALLTQGRSKHISAVILTQRPAWISRFVFSEADFFAVFHLNDKEDRLKVQRFIPREQADIQERLPEYHSYWYDVKNDFVAIMQPVPSADEIMQKIDDKLKPRHTHY